MPEQTSKEDRGLLEELLGELQQESDGCDGAQDGSITKGQALVRSMVNEALKGDQKMLANVLKFIEKLDALQNGKRQNEAAHSGVWSKTDWEMLFHFFWRYKPHIELELERMQAENPGVFKGEWEEVKLQQAPWYEAVHGVPA